ncbi:MAG: ABC transporter ATP-binding protein [Deltaproteobacteria bacterium]|nr:ABC transporter ATP-binding protein [Deltaproteobacteria bacterium]
MAIQIKDLSHSYGALPVLKGLNVHIQKGEFFIILGPNGSGKTTLLKTICGLEPFQHGSVELFGRSFSSYARKALAKTLSFVGQVPPADLPFTVLQTVLMGRFPHLGVLGLATEKDVEMANQVLEISGISHLANRKLDQLSGGERQRVFIARALCQEPKLLILDEPTASLDLSHQLRIMDLMESLKKEKQLTIVMVSHDINLAAMYADRLLLMNDGQVVSIGKPWDVLTFDTLEETYGCTILVDESPMGKFPRITLVPRRYLQNQTGKSATDAYIDGSKPN